MISKLINFIFIFIHILCGQIEAPTALPPASSKDIAQPSVNTEAKDKHDPKAPKKKNGSTADKIVGLVAEGADACIAGSNQLPAVIDGLKAASTSLANVPDSLSGLSSEVVGPILEHLTTACNFLHDLPYIGSIFKVISLFAKAYQSYNERKELLDIFMAFMILTTKRIDLVK